MFSRSVTMPLATCLLAVCACGAVAATPTISNNSGWYLGTGFGVARNAVSDLDAALHQQENRSATGFKLYGGYQFHPNWAAELEYVNFGKYTSESARSNVSAKASGIGLSMVGRLPLMRNLSMLGKAGLMIKTADTEEYVDNDRVYSEKSHRGAALLGVGTEYRFTHALSLRAEYEYAGASVIGEKGSMLNNQLFSLSLHYHF